MSAIVLIILLALILGGVGLAVDALQFLFWVALAVLVLGLASQAWNRRGP